MNVGAQEKRTPRIDGKPVLKDKDYRNGQLHIHKTHHLPQARQLANEFVRITSFTHERKVIMVHIPPHSGIGKKAIILRSS